MFVVQAHTWETRPSLQKGFGSNQAMSVVGCTGTYLGNKATAHGLSLYLMRGTNDVYVDRNSTEEPLNNGHFGTSKFVCYIALTEVKNVLSV